MKKYYIGLDIGGTKCCVLLAYVDRGIHISDKIRFETRSERSFEDIYEQLTNGIREIIARNGLSTEQLKAIGISCGGPLDSRRGIVLSPPNLPSWVNIPITEMLSRDFQIPAYLQNDANACALVEWQLGAGRGCDNMIFLTMGTGMGGGIIADGKLLRGITDMGGEVGHIRLTDGGPLGFGKAGSFEGYTSGGGIQRQACEWTKRLIAEGKRPAWADVAERDIDGKLLSDYARRGDEQAKAFFEHVGTMLGKGLAILTDTLNPEKIVIGSVFVRCEDLLRPSMERALREEALPEACAALRVVPAETGEALGDYASIMSALYAENIDPMSETVEHSERVLTHFERLFNRYPILEENREQIMEAYLMLRDCYRNGGKVMTVGNGGSCADSEHIVGELMKGFYLKRPLDSEKKQAIDLTTAPLLSDAAEKLQQGLSAIALTCHSALNTAFGNDCDPNLSAAQQVVGYGRSGDVLIGISTSGNAANVALAVATAKALGISTLGLTGGTGGKLKTLCDISIVTPAHTPADVQELHLPIYHTLCAMLEAKFFDQ